MKRRIGTKPGDRIFEGVIVAVLAVAVPCKIKFVKWWSRREQEKKQKQRGKWGDDA